MAKQKKEVDTNLEPAFTHFGSPKALAEALGLSYMAVLQWKKRGIPPERARQISEITGGKIKPGDLKPKLFGRIAGKPVVVVEGQEHAA